MVDWKQLAEKWTEISQALREQIINTMRQKQKDSPQKFEEWLKEDPGRRIIWNNYAAPKVAPIAPPAAQPVVPPVSPKVSVPTPTMTKGLTEKELDLLQDEFNNVLFRNLGRVPANSSSTFRVELAKVKNKPYQEVLEHILNEAQDIADEFHARETIRKAAPIKPAAAPREPTRIPEVSRPPPEIGAGGEEEEGGATPAPGSRAPPAQFPSFAIDYNLPFPRGPTSRERLRIWAAFRYQMQQQGFDVDEYERQFNDYIANTQFLSWENLREKYDEFFKTIKAGQQLPPLFVWRGTPIPTGLRGTIQEGTELERLRDLIVHYTSVVIRNKRSMGEIPTVMDLKDELTERGIIPENTSIDELRTNAKSAWSTAVERKDVWTSGISSAEFNDFITSA